MRALLFAWICTSFVMTVPAAAFPEPLQRLDVAGHTLEVEIADTPAKRERGLMHRRALADNRGMLFVFDEPQIVTMWMKNTPIDLDVAFIDACGRILNIERMKALSLRLHASAGPAARALEVRAGWFAERGLTAGLLIDSLAVENARCPKQTRGLRAPK